MLLPLLCVQKTTAGPFGGLELCDFPATVFWTLPGGSQLLRELNLPSKRKDWGSELRASTTGYNGRLQMLLNLQR